MTYENFYKIANYLNECNNNIFSSEEVACNAYDYLIEYQSSIENNYPTMDMFLLCWSLVEDMDYPDYLGIENDDLDIETMEKVFEEFLENY